MNFEELSIPVEFREPVLPMPCEVTYWSLRKHRVFWIDYEIDDNYDLLELGKEIIRINIEDKDKENPNPIYIYIYSYGGDIVQSLWFGNLCQCSKVPIITIATGVAMSSGLLILLSGKRKYAFQQSEVLIHQGYATFSGSAQEIEAAQESYKKQQQVMKEYILSHTKISESLFKKQEKKDWYVTGDELVTLGIVDKIVTDFSDIV